MAENKKSFVLYTDIIHVFANLTNEESGKLIKHLLEYVNDKDPQTDDRIIQIAFEPIKLQLKRDLKHWESVVNKRKDAGKLGGLAKASKAKQDVANLAVNVNVNDNVNVNVNDNVNNIEQRKLKFSESLKPFLELYGKEMLNNFYAYWTEPNKSGKKFKQELQITWDTARRLKTWSNNNFSSKKIIDKSILTQAERDEFMRNAGKM